MKNLHFVFAAGMCALSLTGCTSPSRPPEAQDTLLHHETASRAPRKPFDDLARSQAQKGPKDVYARGLDEEDGELLSQRSEGVSLWGEGSEQLPVYMDDSRVLKTAFFGFDESSLSAESRQALKALVRELPLGDPSAKILVVGRADWFGSEDYNMSLGDRRARSVLSYLTAIGVPASRMELLSRGKLDATPGKVGDAKSLSAQDRRADIYKLWP